MKEGPRQKEGKGRIEHNGRKEKEKGEIEGQVRGGKKNK